MMFCVSSGFISLYLQGRQLSNGEIGTVTAVFGVLAAVLQPILGGVVDRDRRFTWRTMVLILAVPFLLTCISMPLIGGKWPAAISIGLLILLMNVMLPFINSALIYYTDAGVHINFGVARGIGSGLFALMALVIGWLARQYGIEAVPLTGVIVATAFILVVVRMPLVKGHETQRGTAKPHQHGFLRRYPAFSIMLLASLMMLTTHSIVNIYLLQIIQSIGGLSGQLGVAMAIQAIVEVPILFGFSKLFKGQRLGTLMVVSAAGFSLKAFLFALSGSVMMIYITELAQMISYAIFVTASVLYTSECVAKEDQTTGQAFMASMFAAGTVVGSLLGGWLLELAGMKVMLLANVVISILGVCFALISNKQLKPARNLSDSEVRSDH